MKLSSIKSLKLKIKFLKKIQEVLKGAIEKASIASPITDHCKFIADVNCLIFKRQHLIIHNYY